MAKLYEYVGALTKLGTEHPERRTSEDTLLPSKNKHFIVERTGAVDEDGDHEVTIVEVIEGDEEVGRTFTGYDSVFREIRE